MNDARSVDARSDGDDEDSLVDVALIVLSKVMTGPDLAAAIGYEPDEAWTLGEPIHPDRSAKPQYRVSGVRYESRLPESARAEEQLAELLSRLRPFTDRLRALGTTLISEDGNDIPLRFWVYSRGRRGWRPFDFSPALLAEVAALGAYLGLDIYLFKDEIVMHWVTH
jgi:hypothetical protein